MVKETQQSLTRPTTCSGGLHTANKLPEGNEIDEKIPLPLLNNVPVGTRHTCSLYHTCLKPSGG